LFYEKILQKHIDFCDSLMYNKKRMVVFCMNKITVDFSVSTGNIKPVHGVCCTPYTKDGGPEQKKYYDFSA